MRRFLIVCVAVLVAAPVALAAHGPATPSASHGAPAARARLRNFICQRALDPPARAVSVQAVMRPIAGTKSLALRFQLLRRAKGAASFTPVRGGDLGAWLSPASPTLGQRPGDVWVLNHPVGDLPAPASYRFRVSFRWTGAAGKVLATAERLSATCVQPELRPNLRVKSISIAPIVSRPKLVQYSVVIANLGATAAMSFDVRLTTADGTFAKTHTVKRLSPHSRHTETFVGPACTAAVAPTVVLDPAQVVDDLDRSDNTLSVPASCPATTTQ